MTTWFVFDSARVNDFTSYYNSRSSEIGEIVDLVVTENGNARRMMSSERIDEDLTAAVVANVPTTYSFTDWPGNSGWLGTKHF